MSGRRQPARSARASRGAYSRPSHGGTSSRARPQAGTHQGSYHERQHGFFPGLTHFTDSLAALPKEVMRHFTMMKEVEAKDHAANAELSRMADAVGDVEGKDESDARPGPSSGEGLRLPEISTLAEGTHNGPAIRDLSSLPLSLSAAERRAELMRRMVYTLVSMGPVLDEKIAVLSAANATVAKQLARMDDSFPYVSEEISENARLGSLTHWALRDREDEPSRRLAADAPLGLATSGLTAGQSSLAPLATAADEQPTRREPKRGRATNGADMEDDRTKKPTTRTRKEEAKPTSSPQPTTKRRKTEKADKAGPSVAAKEANATGGAAGAQADATTQKRKSRAGQTRKRAAASKRDVEEEEDKADAEKAASIETSTIRRGTSRRPAKKRGHESGSESEAEKPDKLDKAEKPEKADKAEAEKAEVEKKESEKAEPRERPDKQKGTAGGPANGADKSAKVAEKGADKERADRGDKGGRAEKKAESPKDDTKDKDRMEDVPVGTGPAEEPEAPTPKESTKGARLSPMEVDVPAPVESKAEPERAAGPEADVVETEADPDADPDVDPDENENDGEGEGEENDGDDDKYCYCNQGSYGEMVACDNESCPTEWFHLKCAGLREAPPETSKWFCDGCRAKR